MLDNMYSAGSLFISILIFYWIGYKIAKRKYGEYERFIITNIKKEIKKQEELNNK